jgi:hypothetical protein
MNKATNKRTDFLAAMGATREAAPTVATPTPANTSEAHPAKPVRSPSRAGLKHIGGYFDRADVEKIAILRARLGLDNSELIRLAISELYIKHEAKRAFGDA